MGVVPWPGSPEARNREIAVAETYERRLDAVMVAHRAYTSTDRLGDDSTILQLDRAQAARRAAHDLALSWRAARGHAIEGEAHEAVVLALLLGEQDAASHERMWGDVVGFLQDVLRDQARRT